uniref:Uncharacterized protein n=1 Tax=viral metagenome TaxID=1070528 RepID=A0A6M3IFH6_9ZZZZ
MNLLGIRQQFIKLSGRYDLATTTVSEFDTDNGANFFINAGQRFLDRRFYHAKTIGRYFKQVAASSWYLTFQHCRSILTVWCNDDEDRWQLTKYDYDTIRNNYDGLVSGTDTGSPSFYCPVWIRSPLATDKDVRGAFFNYVKTDDDGTYNGILFVPPTDAVYIIEIIGHFYFSDLSSNTETNYWTNVAPEALIKAALYQLETFYRNSEGARDWLNAITLDVQPLEFDAVEQESNDPYVRE